MTLKESSFILSRLKKSTKNPTPLVNDLHDQYIGHMATSKIKVTSNINQLPAFITSINEKAVKQAVRRSIKRTIPSATKASFDEIKNGQLLNTRMMTYKKLKERRFIRSYTNKSDNIYDMAGIIELSDKRPGMQNFILKKFKAGTNAFTKKPLYGVQAKIMGKEQRLGRAFMHGKVVLARKGPKRYPLRFLYGPSIAHMLTKTGRINNVITHAEGRFSKEMEDNLSFFLARI